MGLYIGPKFRICLGASECLGATLAVARVRALATDGNATDSSTNFLENFPSSAPFGEDIQFPQLRSGCSKESPIVVLLLSSKKNAQSCKKHHCQHTGYYKPTPSALATDSSATDSAITDLLELAELRGLQGRHPLRFHVLSNFLRRQSRRSRC